MSDTEKRCLIVDDDRELSRMLAQFLRQNGIDAREAGNAVEAQKELSRWRFDALILDQMMPGEDGLSMLLRLRKGGDRTPALMLTAKAQEADRVLGLESGADDFIAKPFSPRELLARLQAIWRRANMIPSSAAPEMGKSAQLGRFVLDFASRSLQSPEIAQGSHALSSGEFALLKAFALNPGVALSRDRLMKLCDEKDRDAFDRAIDVRVARARKLLTTLGLEPTVIQTVRGLGYAYMPSSPGAQPSAAPDEA